MLQKIWAGTIKFNFLSTIVVEVFQVYTIGTIVKLDESLAVSPALYDDATRLWVEWKQCGVQITWRLHDSTKPPSHFTRVTHMRAKQVKVMFVEEVTCAVYNPQKILGH